MKTYTVNEVFWSPQGEGIRAGQMSCFVRFTGCNLRCSVEPGEKSPGGFDCDTEFTSGRKLTADELIAEIKQTIGRDDVRGLWVVFTGGEPGLQLDADLVHRCDDEGLLCAIETNGSVDVSRLHLDWVVVSPKVAEHCVRQLKADELRYVRGYGQALPVPSCVATHKLISPAHNGLDVDARALAWCIDLIKENPEWRLSVQMHKAWSIR